jgi:hypothetical protein
LTIHARAIAGYLSRLKADALDASRVTRVPGSLNGKCDKVVGYEIFGGRDRPVTYTLADLAEWLRVEPKKHRAKVQAAPSQPKSADSRRRWRLLQASRLRQFEKLRTIRGGFLEGCRNHAAVLYTHFLTRNGVTGVALDRQIEQFARECHPPLASSELRGAMQTGSKMKTGKLMITNRRIAEWLNITPEESEVLETWPAAPCFGGAAANQLDENTTRAERASARHAAIEEIMNCLNGNVPSLRKMKTLLRELGHVVSHVTIRNDYRVLGLAASADCSRGFFGTPRMAVA